MPTPPALPRRCRSPRQPDALEELTNEELLALLFGAARAGASHNSARRLVDFAIDLEGLARLAPSVIATHAGIPRSKAVQLHAAFELGRRRWAVQSVCPRIDSLQAVVDWARPRLLPLDHEEVWLLNLDGRNAMRSSRRVAQGGLHSCTLTARDILRPALRDGASAIVLVHNHPSGDPTPSDADVNMTAEVDVACATVGLPLLDHVVVASEGAVSMLELGVVRAE